METGGTKPPAISCAAVSHGNWGPGSSIRCRGAARTAPEARFFEADESWARDTSNPEQARLAVRYARVFNALDETWMTTFIIEDSRYASQNVLEPLEGHAITKYWCGKLATLRAQGACARVAADVGMLTDERSCAIMYQARGLDDRNWLSTPTALVLVEADRTGLLSRADMVTVAPSHSSSAAQPVARAREGVRTAKWAGYNPSPQYPQALR